MNLAHEKILHQHHKGQTSGVKDLRKSVHNDTLLDETRIEEEDNYSIYQNEDI